MTVALAMPVAMVVAVPVVAVVPWMAETLRNMRARAIVSCGPGESVRCGRARTMNAAPSFLMRQNIQSQSVVPMKSCRFLCHCCTLGILRPR